MTTIEIDTEFDPDSIIGRRLCDILDVDELGQLVRDRFVRIQTHPDDVNLRIYNYAKNAYANPAGWTDTLRECRGLIVRTRLGLGYNLSDFVAKAEVLARPLPKFFNAFESESDWLNDPLVNDSFTVAFDKVDGSMGAAYVAPDGLPAIATRGSFASEQALHATELLRREHPNYQVVPGVTDVFEIVYPENRIVLDYGTEDKLVYLASREVETGRILVMPRGAVTSEWATIVASGPLDAVLTEVNKNHLHRGKEGVVIYVLDSSPLGYRLAKVKEAEYLRLQRLVTNLSERTVWELLVTDDAAKVEEAAAGLPEEQREWFHRVENELDAKFDDIFNHVQARTLAYKEEAHSRPEFAALVLDQHPDDAALYFLYHDGNFDKLTSAIWKMLKPAGKATVGTPTLGVAA